MPSPSGYAGILTRAIGGATGPGLGSISAVHHGVFCGGQVYATDATTMAFQEMFAWYATDSILSDLVARDIASLFPATSLFPAPGGSDTLCLVYADYTVDPPTWNVTTGASTGLPVALVTIPAGDSDCTHWTVVDIRTFTPYLLEGGEPVTTSLITADFTPVTSTSLTSLTGVALHYGKTYRVEGAVLFQSANVGAGLALGLTWGIGSGVLAATARIPIAADGTDSEFVGQITSDGDKVVGTGVEVVNTTYLATLTGIVKPTLEDTIYLKYARGGASASNITVKAGSSFTVTCIG